MADNDMRASNAWGTYARHLKDEGRELVGNEASISLSAFGAGWRARLDAALGSVGIRDGRDGKETDIIRDQMDMLRREHARAFDVLFRDYEHNRRQQRQIEAMREQIRVLGGDPIDAPAHRRISEQRREIKRLTKLATMLYGEIAQQSPGPVSGIADQKDRNDD